MRFFNTTGPVNCKEHYCLNPLDRFDLEEILLLIRQKKYFVMHAPRQTGKTSCLLALMKYLNENGKYRCLYINVESAQTARENTAEGIRSVLAEMASRARDSLSDNFLQEIWYDIFQKFGGSALNEALTLWSAQSPVPAVLFIDEIDTLVGDTLISVLRQIRAGYDKRPGNFPQCIILCGMRDVRDYRIHASKEKDVITGGSAFNIKARSLRIGDFSEKETRQLLLLHTAETGQIFSEDALENIWELSQGQPWLVNALAYEVCFEIRENRDRGRKITGETVQQAKENLILRRETHLDQLADKLKEERGRRVIGPVLSGNETPGNIPEDDLQYVCDLGLIRRKPHVSISNPVYREIIPRMLTGTVQDMLPHETQWYVGEDGRLDMKKLLTAFQQFFREHSEHWVERFDYKEAGPQLLMQAFLQRIVNSGGRVEREYGLGRKRTDLLVLWKYGEKTQRIVIELKILHKSLKMTLEEGLPQTAEYMDKCGAEEGHLVIFDRGEKSWEEKIFQREEEYEGRKIQVWGM
ncbi:MAG: ATP-binding protein [Desulfococcaceae bacterium]|nr:ATP-binding protein [Desulfococcaceae bacterium]